jgi:ACR3 family arsenite efflux pump ArsB
MFNQIQRFFLNLKVAKCILLFLYTVIAVFSFSSNSFVSKMAGLLTIACGFFVFTVHIFSDTNENSDVRQALSSFVGLFAPLVIGIGSYLILTREKEAFNNTELSALFALGVLHCGWLALIVIRDTSSRFAIQRQLNSLFKK